MGADGPIASAEVFAGNAVARVATARTDQDGQFALEAEAGEQIYIWSAPPGHAPMYVRVTPPVAGVQIDARPESTLTGTVVGQEGASPVAGVEVMVHRVPSDLGGPIGATTDEQGRFRVGGLAPGRYEIVVGSDGWFGAAATVALGHAETIDVPAVEVSRGVKVEGHVRFPSDVPDEASVAFVSSAGRRGAVAPIASDGKFEIEGVPPGPFVVELRAGPWIIDPGHAELLVDEGTEPLVFEVARGRTIRGVVRRDVGMPMPGVEVIFRRQGFERSTVSDAEGRFSFEGIAARRAQLEWSSGRLDVELGDEDADVTLYVSEKSVVTVRLVDWYGDPIDRANLHVISFVGDEEVHSIGEDVPAADGRFVFTGLDPGRYRFVPERLGFGELRGPDGSRTRLDLELGVRDAQTHEIVVEPLDETLTGRVVDADGHPAAGVFVAAAREGDDTDDHDGLFHARNDTSCAVVTDDAGAFEIERLGRGTYSVVAYRPRGDLMLNRGVELGARIVLVLEPPGAVCGRLVDVNGDPVATAHVDFDSDDDPLFRTEEITLADGAFEIGGLSRGVWRLTCESERASRTFEVITIPGETVDVGTITLASFGTVRGRVFDADGRPAAEIEVVSTAGAANVMATTDEEGWYTLRVPVGRASVSVLNGRGHTSGVARAERPTVLPPMNLQPGD